VVAVVHETHTYSKGVHLLKGLVLFWKRWKKHGKLVVKKSI